MPPAPVPEPWSREEIDRIVADYFAMLADELAGAAPNKAEHNRNLQAQIGRSRGSIEYKHQNISAILLGLGQPWIEGYKPAANFQGALVDGILRWLGSHPGWLQPELPARAAVQDAPALWIGPPPTHRNEPPPVDAGFMARIAQKYDAAERDARNRALGAAGERLVLDHERQQLKEAGRPDLAERIRWTAAEDGDGLGYDISSFERDGRERLIEVKTTNGWERTPFHISRNELRVASDRRETWHLIRVWNFAREPRAFALRPPLEAHAELTPSSFLATLR